MALLKCTECGHDVSEYADKCPNCGCPIDIIKSSIKLNKESCSLDKEMNELQNKACPICKATDRWKIESSNMARCKICGYALELDESLMNIQCTRENVHESKESVAKIDKKCPVCGVTKWLLHEESGTAICEVCGYCEVVNEKKTEEYMHNISMVSKAKNQVHCPYCNSTNVNKISGSKKAASIIGFGILSNKIGKQWHCNSCKSDF